MLHRHAIRLLWRALAVLCIALGMIGVVLPGLPTVPFLLVAAWAGGKGWPSVEAWLLHHPRYGPSIRRWRDHGAVPRSAKWAATAMMCASAVAIALSPMPVVAKIAVPALMLVVALWLWRRPEA